MSCTGSTAGRPTSSNLVELCDQHHRCVHEMGWKMSGDANVELTFRSPTGRLSTSTPSPAFTCSARRTAWLIASCRATFSARPGTRTRTSAGDELVPASAASSSDSRDHLVDREPESACDRADVAGGWRAEEAARTRAASTEVAWGRNEKIPPPPLSSTTNVQGTSGRFTRPETSWRNARSPSKRDRCGCPAPAPRRRRPSAVETTPSIPFTPRLASTRGGAAAVARRTTRGPGSAWTPTPRRWRPARRHGDGRRGPPAAR